MLRPFLENRSPGIVPSGSRRDGGRVGSYPTFSIGRFTHTDGGRNCLVTDLSLGVPGFRAYKFRVAPKMVDLVPH